MKKILAQQASVYNKPENSVINPVTREISQAKVDSNLNRGDDKLAKSIVDKTGDGLNSNVIKLSDHITKLNKTIQTSIKVNTRMSEKQVGDVTSNAMGKRQFNTLRPRVEGFKENVKDFFSMRGFLDKTGIAKRGSGGLVSEYLDRGEAKKKYIDQRMQTKGTTFGSKETFARQFDEQQNIQSEIRKNENKIKELQASGATDVGLKRGGFLKKREELATQYAKVAPDARPTTESKSEDTDKDTGKVLPFKKSTADAAGSEEALLEQNKMVAEQTDLLIKIEENTRGGGKGKPKTKAGAGGENQGGGSGGMGLMDMLGLTGLGGKVLGGVKTAGRFLGGAALTGAKFIGRNPLLMAGTAVAAGAYTGYKGYQAAGEKQDAENAQTDADLAAGKITKEQADERKLKTGESSTVGKSKSVGKGTGMAVGGAAGALKGAALGAALGSVVPVIGTAIGGLLGGAIGGIGGSYLGGKAGDYLGEKTGQAINYVGKAKNSVLGMFGKGDKVVDNGDGSNSTFKPDGSKVVQDASGTKTFDTSGKLISQTSAVTAPVAAAPVAPVSAASKAEQTRMAARGMYQEGTKEADAAKQKLDAFKKANPFDIKAKGDIESGSYTPGKFTDPKKQKEYDALMDVQWNASDKKEKAQKSYQTADKTQEYKFNKAGQEVRNYDDTSNKKDILTSRFGYNDSDLLNADGQTYSISKINTAYDKEVKKDLTSKDSPAATAPAAKDANIAQGQPLKSGPQVGVPTAPVGGTAPVLAEPVAAPAASGQTKSMIAGEPWTVGQELSKKQLVVMSSAIAGGTTYSARVMRQYNKQKGIAEAPVVGGALGELKDGKVTSPAAEEMKQKSVNSEKLAANIAQGQGKPISSQTARDTAAFDKNFADTSAQIDESDAATRGIAPKLANSEKLAANISQGGKPPVLVNSKTQKLLIGGEEFVEGSPLSDKQMRAISMKKMMDKNNEYPYPARVDAQYAKQQPEFEAANKKMEAEALASGKKGFDESAGMKPASGINGDVLSKKSTANEQAKMEAAKSSSGNNTSVIAPTVNNTSNQTQLIKPQIRNQESSQTRYQDSRYAF